MADQNLTINLFEQAFPFNGGKGPYSLEYDDKINVSLDLPGALEAWIYSVHIYSDSNGQQGEQFGAYYPGTTPKTVEDPSGTPIYLISGDPFSAPTTITIQDKERFQPGSSEKKYHFTVSVTNNQGEVYTSDPEMINKGGN